MRSDIDDLDGTTPTCEHHIQRAGGPSGSDRVKRGGSFDNDDDNLRVSNRNDDDPSDSDDNLGGRCCSSRHRQTGRLHGRGLRAGRDHRPPSRAGESQTKSSAWAGSDKYRLRPRPTASCRVVYVSARFRSSIL